MMNGGANKSNEDGTWDKQGQSDRDVIQEDSRRKNERAKNCYWRYLSQGHYKQGRFSERDTQVGDQARLTIWEIDTRWLNRSGNWSLDEEDGVKIKEGLYSPKRQLYGRYLIV